MERIENYQLFLENREVEYILMELNESFLSDMVDITRKSFKKKAKNISKQYQKLSKSGRKKLISGLVILLMANGGIGMINQAIDTPEFKEVPELVEEIKDVVAEKQYRIGYEFDLSESGKDIIKKHEGYRNTAYRLKDGKITIGYGHAEPVRNSQFKVGDKITKERAEELFIEDTQDAINGVRRIFKQWEKRGNEVLINQEMFDAMVSLTYNAGIGNVRKSAFIQSIKRGEFEKAAEEIATFKINPNYKKGLTDRRKEEVALFLSKLN